MKVIRTTIVTPREGAAKEVAQLLAQIGEHLSKQPGFVQSYSFEDKNEEGYKLGRLSVWGRREDADHAANQMHTLALRSKMNHLLVDASEEHLLDVLTEDTASAPERRVA